MRFFVLFLLAVFALIAEQAVKTKPQKSQRQSLSGLVLILDPGHGGKDPGSHGNFQGQPVIEADYAYDVAKRVELFAKERSAIVKRTLYNPKDDNHHNVPPDKLLNDYKNRRFSIDDTTVKAGKKGLRKRVAYANQVAAKYPRHVVVFLAVHFDVINNKEAQGIHLIVPEGRKRGITDPLAAAFGTLASATPVKVSGQGVKHIYVLGGANQVHERILIELGNFKNDADNWRIRNYKTRNTYALRIVNGLEKFLSSKRAAR